MRRNAEHHCGTLAYAGVTYASVCYPSRVEAYVWPLVDEFLDREDELARLEEWWAGPERMPINLYGRRRAGKSWLLRRFSHGKPAIILAGEQLAPGDQLTRFAATLEPALGVRPQIPDIATLFRVLFRLARRSKTLVVIDELPWLLPTAESDAERALSSIQAVMEEEQGGSALKLVVCGSAIAQMQGLMAERGPLHGRLVPMEIRPLRYAQARLFLTHLAPLERIERFGIAGGMPRYLDLLGHGSLAQTICSRVLDRNAPLWNEGRAVLEQELRQPGAYFSILEQLASSEKEVGKIAAGAHIESTSVSRYLATLADLRIVRRKLPVGASLSRRSGHWELSDLFMRFWFRFVFPFQAELEAALAPADLWRSVVKPAIADQVAPVFEELCRDWVLANHGELAQRVGGWWGNARDDLRRARERTSEEIDLVGLAGDRVTVVGECRWRSRPMDGKILHELETYKLPALRQSGLKIDEHLQVLLFSRSGFNAALRQSAAKSPSLRLIEASEIA